MNPPEHALVLCVDEKSQIQARPRQFMVIWENSRCSTLFHFKRPRREVAAGDLQPGLHGQGGQLGLNGSLFTRWIEASAGSCPYFPYRNESMTSRSQT